MQQYAANPGSLPDQSRSMAEHEPLARAINALNIEVTIPSQFHGDAVAFVADVLSLPVTEPPTASRVVSDGPTEMRR